MLDGIEAASCVRDLKATDLSWKRVRLQASKSVFCDCLMIAYCVGYLYGKVSMQLLLEVRNILFDNTSRRNAIYTYVI